jgi:glutathione reductase (NADPH)
MWASPQLSAVATYEDRIAGRNIVEGPKYKPIYSDIPSCVLTVPALASVGITELSAHWPYGAISHVSRGS